MDYSKIDIFGVLQAKMRYLSQRQAVLAENIAHADTPNYKPKDIEKPDFKDFVAQESARLEMRATSSGHLGGGANGGASAGFDADQQYKTYETSPTNNSSVIEEQMMKISQTAADYQLSTNLYAKMSNLFKLVLGNKA